jgi:phage antirepressor YoqD-like protein
MTACSGVCIPLLFMMREKYNRLEIDELQKQLNVQITVKAPKVQNYD